jgi:hypothetical protein
MTRTVAPRIIPERSEAALFSSALSSAASMRAFRQQWDLATRDREKRQGRRRSLRCQVRLTDETSGGNGTHIIADCLNIGDHGLFAILPEGVEAAIGQRYTFRLAIGERGPEPGCHQYVSQSGEVRRVELLLNEMGTGIRIGIGVRLLGPRSGSLPMPS